MARGLSSVQFAIEVSANRPISATMYVYFVNTLCLTLKTLSFIYLSLQMLLHSGMYVCFFIFIFFLYICSTSSANRPLFYNIILARNTHTQQQMLISITDYIKDCLKLLFSFRWDWLCSLTSLHYDRSTTIDRTLELST